MVQIWQRGHSLYLPFRDKLSVKPGGCIYSVHCSTIGIHSQIPVLKRFCHYVNTVSTLLQAISHYYILLTHSATRWKYIWEAGWKMSGSEIQRLASSCLMSNVFFSPFVSSPCKNVSSSVYPLLLFWVSRWC